MRQQLAEVAAIVHETAAPMFDNTIVALERSGQLLQRVQRVFDALTSANTNDTLQRIQEAVAPRLAAHRDAFSHIWNGGYSAGYYAYIWSEVIDADAYAWFLEHGGLTRENGQRFRDMILARGGSGDVAALYRAFRGRDPEIGPLLANRGLTGGTR